MTKQFIKSLAQKAAPRTFAVVQAIRSRRLSHRLCIEWGQRELGDQLKAEFGSKVQSGPFKNLLLPDEAFKEHVGPFLLGTYEAELHPWIDLLMSRRFLKVVDIGSKFGYYAVGFNVLGLGQPSAIAFDIDPWAQKATLDMARANSAVGLTVAAFCTREWLADNVDGECLIISDCEGYESKLFTGAIPANFKQSTFLIETHDHNCPGVTDAIKLSFAATHDCQSIENVKQDFAEIEKKDFGLSSDVLRRAACEVRGEQKWILLTPKLLQNKSW